jgi:hypothetical protein
MAAVGGTCGGRELRRCAAGRTVRLAHGRTLTRPNALYGRSVRDVAGWMGTVARRAISFVRRGGRSVAPVVGAKLRHCAAGRTGHA